MEKKIEDYLHLYLGCRIKRFSKSGVEHESVILTPYELNRISQETYPFRVEPLLRPLSSMTETEIFLLFSFDPDSKGEIPTRANISGNFIQCEYGRERTMWMHASRFLPEQFTFLLESGFDLFGLIPAGLAIDSTTLKPTEK